MAHNYKIVKMEPAHLDQVYQIEELSFFTPWSKKSILSEMENPMGRYLVILEDDTVVSYGGFWIVPPEANINNVAVTPSHRGRGISRILMNHLIQMAKEEGAEKMFLEVRTGNGVAQSLYRSLGFKMVGLRSKYYVDTDEDAIVMELDMTGGDHE